MAFIFPVLLGGLALLSIPVLIHLILRQKPKTLQFPAFRFLLQRHKTNLRKLRLRHLLLLALRILILAAICLALTRPRLTNQTLGLSRERPVAAVLLFDTSPSMEMKTSEGVTRLEEAKKRGLEFLDELPEGSRVAILDTAANDVATRGDGLLPLGQARERINNLKQRFANASVSKRLVQAYRLLAEVSRSKEEGNVAPWPRVLFILSDRTRAAWDGADRATLLDAADMVVPMFEGLQQARADIPIVLDQLNELRAKVPPPAGKDYGDQSLREALEELQNRLPGMTKDFLPPEPILDKIINDARRRTRTLLAQVRGAVGEDAYRGKLSGALEALARDLAGAQALWIDVGIDQPVDAAIVQLEFPTPDGRPKQLFAADDTIVVRAVVQAIGKDFSTDLICQLGSKTYRQAVEVKAGGNVTVPFEIDPRGLKLAPGPHQLEIRLATTDLLTFNNQRFATFAMGEPRRVLILADHEDRAYDLRYALGLRGFTPEIKVPNEAARLTLLDYQAIFLLGLKDPQAALWEALEGYVGGGGGLGVVPGDDMVRKAYNEGPALALLPGEFTSTKDDKVGATWNWDAEAIYQHPLLNPFRAWRFPPVDFIAYPRRAFQYYEVTPYKEGTVLVNYADANKSPALLERRFPKGRGKVLMFTTPLHPLGPLKPRWNNYLEDLTSFYLVLADHSARYLAGDTETPHLNFQTGKEPPRVAPALSDRYPAYKLRGPEMLEDVIAPEQGGLLSFPQATAPGNYTVEGVGGAAPRRVGAFSVNLPAEESDLSRVPAAELESIFGPEVIIPLDRKASLKDSLAGHWQEPVELFAFLMVLLLVLLAVENLAANKFYRRQT